MYAEDLKKQFMSSRDLYTAKRWEGKPLSFKFKFALANYPEFLLTALIFTFFVPPVCYYRYKSFPDSKRDAIRKYKANYMVVRDDHPNIKEIIKEKEKGRHFFPK